MTLISMEGINALGNERFYRTIIPFNLEIPKYQALTIFRNKFLKTKHTFKLKDT